MPRSTVGATAGLWDSGFPVDPKARVARRDRLRARALTTTVVATVVAAPVFALWAAYRGTPVGEGQDGRSASAREDGGTVDLDGEEAGAGYENTGNATTHPGLRFGENGEADVSVEVVGVAGAGHEDTAALGVTAGHSGDTTLITLTATGSEPVRWSASTGASWLYLSRSSGTLAPGESVTIRAYVDQLREPSGHWSATVAISPAGSVVTIDGYGTAPSAPGSGSPSGHPGAPGTAHPGTPSGPPPSSPGPDPDPEPTPTTPEPAEPTPGEPPSSPEPEPSTGGPTPTGPTPGEPVPTDSGPAGPEDSPGGPGTASPTAESGAPSPVTP